MSRQCVSDRMKEGRMSTQQKQSITPWKFNSSPLKIYHPKRRVVFQTIIFQGRAVKLREGIYLIRNMELWKEGQLNTIDGL